MELVDLPKLKVNSKVKYLGATATIIGCWWDGQEWRYEVVISRGKKKGNWSVTEGGLLNGAA